MSTYTKLKAINDSIDKLQHLQCVHLQMPDSTDGYISDTISILLKEKHYLQYKLNKEGNIAKKSLDYLKALFN